MPTTAKQLIEAANAAVPKITGAQAQEMVAKGAVIIDVRDSAEVAQTGKAVGALHIPRGSLEFKADPTSPTAEKSLSTDKTVILHCASGEDALALRRSTCGVLSRGVPTLQVSGPRVAGPGEQSGPSAKLLAQGP